LISKGEKLEITPTKCGHIIYAEEHIIAKVLAMEKEQHKNTWEDSRIESKGDDFIGKEKTFKEYYNETYGK
jgi:hypothetical protein